MTRHTRRRPFPHSQRQGQGPNQSWPPSGWSIPGILDHMDRADRVCALLKALADPTTPRQVSEHEARAAELRQLGADAAAKLREAHDAVLAFGQLAAADTTEIDVRAPAREAS